MKILTMDSKKGCQVIAGDYDEATKTFTKRVTPKHFMRMMNGYGIQENVIEQLKVLDCATIIIRRRGGSYSASFSTWLMPGIRCRDFGHGLQRFLPIGYMTELK